MMDHKRLASPVDAATRKGQKLYGRHSRESGGALQRRMPVNPFSGMHQGKMDSRFRGNDGPKGYGDFESCPR
jgi:hypothetical protein